MTISSKFMVQILLLFPQKIPIRTLFSFIEKYKSKLNENTIIQK